jgi:Carboxypeptidase regulatory-like domain
VWCAPAALALLLALASASAGASFAETFGSISGVVNEASSGNPIAGIGVCAFSLNAELLSEPELEHAFGCETTDAAGAYTISELRPESYAVTFAAPSFSALNFIPQLYDGKPLSAEPTPVVVPAGGTASNIDAKLAPGGRISGRVTAAATGAPIEHAFAVALEGTAESERFAFAGAGRTDANGEYTINGLATGSYRVAFIASGYEVQAYDHKSSPAEATPIAVTAPELVTGIDGALLPETESSTPGEGLSGLEGEGLPGGPGGTGRGEGPRSTRPEGKLSLVHTHIRVRGRALALVRLACAGRHLCRAKVTLSVRHAIRVKRHRRVVSETIGTSAVLSIHSARGVAAKVILNAAGRRLLRDHGGTIDAELTLVTPRRTREERVVLSATATGTRRSGSGLTG